LTNPRLADADAREVRFKFIRGMVDQIDQIALSYFDQRSELNLTAKSRRDFVTEADKAVEQKIRDTILQAFPDDHLVGEEFGGEDTDNYWLIDPIDGTSNFLSGLPIWAISIAYIENGHPVIGAVSLPVLKRQFFGCKDIGLFERDTFRVAKPNSALVFGIGRNDNWDYGKYLKSEEVVKDLNLYSVCFGSCAASLAFCSAGELAGYIEGSIGFWDCAAGIALCEAANLEVAYENNLGPANSSVCVGNSTALNDLSGLFSSGC